MTSGGAPEAGLPASSATWRERMARPDAVMATALLAFAVLRLAALTRYPLWTDEAWTLEVGRSALRKTLMLHADDQTHPPLFYTALWFWRRLGPDALAWERLLPCLAGIATAVPMVSIARTMRMTVRATWLVILLGAGSGFLVAYSVEIRNYSFLALAATASLALWLRARDGSSDPRLVRLTIANVLLVNTHYFGVFVVAAEWCDALAWARPRVRAMTASAAVAALSLGPWITETIRRARITGHRLDVVNWVQRPALGDMLDPIREAIGASPWLAVDLGIIVLAGGAIAAWALRARGCAASAGIRALLLAIVVPLGVAFVASVAGPKPMWVTRYFIAVAPPLLILLAGALDAFVPHRLTTFAATVALVPAALTTWSLARGTTKPRYDGVVRAVAAAEPSPAADLFVPNAVDVLSLIYTARRTTGLPRPVQVHPIAGYAPLPDSGWMAWSAINPLPGVPPSAELIRHGFVLESRLGFPSDRDSLVVVRFRRRSAE